MARAVQISLDEELLERIDRDPLARKSGRSAFVREAVSLYLRLEDRAAMDDALRRGFGGPAGDSWSDEISPLIEAQAWPDE